MLRPIAQTAAEMMGVPLERVKVKPGDSRFPASCGSGGQWGANNATSGVYAACMKLRESVAQKLGFNAEKYQQSTFGAHFVEVAIDAYTAETRVRRMLAVCAAGRISTRKRRAARLSAP